MKNNYIARVRITSSVIIKIMMIITYGINVIYQTKLHGLVTTLHGHVIA